MTVLTGKKTTGKMGNWDISGLGGFDFRMCGECGVVWAMPEKFIELRREDGATWYCPNGHHWVYSGETEEKKLRRELEATKDRLAHARAARDQANAETQEARHSLRTTKGVVTKLKKRVSAGVCPAPGCQRHFQDLERHIASKHPEFVSDA